MGTPYVLEGRNGQKLALPFDDNGRRTVTKWLPLHALTFEDGTPPTKQATDVAGWAQLSNKEVVYMIPVDCSAGEAFQFGFEYDAELYTAGQMNIHLLVAKAANLDTLTLNGEVYIRAAGGTVSADGYSGSAKAIPEALTELVFAVDAAVVAAGPAHVTAIFTVGGTNDGDAIYVYGIGYSFTEKLVAY